jgi:hypothetical protein
LIFGKSFVKRVHNGWPIGIKRTHFSPKFSIKMMKNIFLTLFLLAASLSAANAQSADEAAIRKAIEAESEAYHTNPDRAAFISYWHITPETRLVYTGLDGGGIFTGNDMKMAAEKGQFPPADQASREFTNYVVRTSGNLGWASFDQKNTLPNGEVHTMREFRMMEKVGGAWKIVSSSVHEYKS